MDRTFTQAGDDRRTLVRKLLERRGIRTGATAAIPPRPPDAPIVLSFPQQRLWFLHQLHPSTSAYNLSSALALSGRLDRAALERALTAIVARHDALRMAFPTEHGEPAVVLHDRPALALQVVDLAGADDRDARLQEALAALAHEPFDIAVAPLFRLRLFRLAETEHVLALTAHHIVFDGWSIAVFVRELAELYRAHATGAAASLVPIAIGYADFAAWQKGRHAAGDFEPDLAYWAAALDGLPPTTLPSDRPRGALATNRGASLAFEIPADLVDRLRALARDCDATLFMAVLAGLFALIGRYTGQTDLAVGSPIAGRGQLETEPLVGLFANTLVLRVDLSGSPSFAEIVERVRRMARDAYAHQDAPFESLVERLQPERHLSQQPLFQVAFAMQHEGIGSLALPGLDVRPIEIPSAASKFDLTIAVTEEKGGLAGSAEFSTDLFDRETIARLLRHYVGLMRAGLDDPHLAFDRLPLLSPDERAQTLGRWRDGLEARVDEPLHRTFERQASRRADAVAAQCGGERLTYAELNARANRLANHLRDLGVGADDRVGLFLDRSLDALVAIVAVLKAGAGYVPIDPVNPPDRVALILEDSGARLFVTTAALRARLCGVSMPVLLLDEAREAIARRSAGNLDLQVDPAQLAYVIYTSGSTGRPKGTLVQHDHVQRLFQSTDPWYRFDAGDVWTLFHSYGFDFSVWEMWGALLYGGRLVVVPYLVSRSPDEFYELLAAERVTVLNQTPSAFRQVIDAEGRRGAPLPLALRHVIFGGEALELESLRPWFVRHGDEHPRLVNMYGITETTVHVTYRPITIADLDGRAGSVIGGPIPDLRLYVLDSNFEPVPTGVAGELFVGGAGVARGYLNRPALTAARFVPDPFGAGGRLYRSGDLGRITATGDVEYLGRLDHQVKIRGFRIELGEIESALAAHEQVREAHVDAIDGEAGERRLAAYVTPRAAERPDAASLRRHLQARLPEYMVPSAIVVIDRLPLTAHGKIDRRALPPPVIELHADETAFEPPLTASERILAEAWQAALGVARVGRHDNYFDLGGDSIRSIKAIALARERGIEVTLQQLFQHQTIAAVAEALGDSGPAAAERSAPFALLSQADRQAILDSFGDAVEDAYPLTRLQQGMLFHGAFSERSTAYHNVSSFHLRVACDAGAFEAAARRLVARHPALRSSLHPTGFDVPVQIVHRAIDTPLTVVDLRVLDGRAQQAAVDAFLQDERLRRFEWTTAPLFRLALHRRGDDELQVTLTEHHAIVDGWSVAVLLSELMRDYLGAIGVMAPLHVEAPAATFADYVREEQRTIADPLAARFWRGQLADAPPAVMPSLPADGAPREAGVIVETRAIDPEVVDRIEAIARSGRMPFRAVLLAAHAAVVAALSGARDVVTGLVVNARPETGDGERAVGLFLNTVPLRAAIRGTWRDLAAAVFDRERELLPFRGYPLAELQRLDGAVPFHTAFNYVHFHAYGSLSRVEGLDVLGQAGRAETDFPLAASFSKDVAGGVVTLSLECAAPGIDRPAAARVADWYVRALRTIADAPDSPAGNWSPISQDERGKLIGWSRGARREPAPALAHEMVASWARDGAEAVRAGDRRLSYADLDRRSTALAGELVRQGAGVEARVGLLSRATPDLIVAMLAVWKAGAAFVPLDPAYPAERLRFMVTDAAPSIVLGEPELLPLLGDTGVGMRALGGEPERPVSGTSVDLPAGDPDRLAYVIYTSGSTGLPKGVAVPHRGLRNLLLGQIPRFDLSPERRVLQFAALGFDAAISEIFTTLAAGATLVLAPRGDLRDPERVLDLMRSHAITTVTLPPAMLASLPSASLPALRTIVSAGEACRAEVVDRWAPTCRFLNAYGPTETSVCATMTGALHAGAGEPSIGRPLENLEAWVLNDSFEPVPAGVPGELFVGGDSLARGYLGRPDLTAERFVPHPLADRPGDRLYRTGDLARWRADGQLEFLGRADSQVKVRGARVELDEVEAAIRRHDAVRHAAVVLRGEAGSVARLVAYVEPTGAAPSVDDLRRHAETLLPDHAVPSAYVVLDRMPLTPSGKIDRRALPAPADVRPALDTEYAAPRNDVEAILADIWRGALKVDRVGIDDNFFALGGDSIVSLQVVSRARSRGLRITPQQVFERPTIAALAPVASSVAAQSVGRPSGAVALTPIQRWFFDLAVPARRHWNQALLLETPVGLDEEALARAFAAVVSNHDAFRLRFAEGATGWVQSYADEAGDVGVERVDLSAFAGAELAGAIERHAGAVQRSLDLQSGPLVRCVHYDCGGPGRLLLVAHHLIVDGVSWRVFLDDLQAAYAEARAGRPISSAPATASLQAWSAALVERTSACGAAAAFWTGAVPTLADAGVAGRALDEGANLERDAARVEVFLDEDDTRDLLQSASHAYSMRAPEVLLAAVAMAMSRWTGRPRVGFALEGHGRDAVDLDVARTIGWFTTMFPLAIDVSRAASARDALIEVKEQVRSVPAEGAPYGMLRYLSPGATIDRGGADVSFNYLGQLDAALGEESPFRPASEPIGPLRDPDATRPHLVDIVCSVERGRVRMTWLYAGRLFERETIERVAADARAELRRLVSHCRDAKTGTLTPSDLPGMDFSRDELDALLDDLDRAEPL